MWAHGKERRCCKVSTGFGVGVGTHSVLGLTAPISYMTLDFSSLNVFYLPNGDDQNLFLYTLFHLYPYNNSVDKKYKALQKHSYQ